MNGWCWVSVAVWLVAGQALAAKPADAGKAPQGCGAKSHCKEMTSCEEARYYLTNCGVKKLDRDGDGIPCESLCGGKAKR